MAAPSDARPGLGTWLCRCAGRKAGHGGFAQRSIPPGCHLVADRSALRALVVLVLAAIVHAAVPFRVYAESSARMQSAAQARFAARTLAPLAAEMRDRIAAAVSTGRIEDLQEPLDLNELPVVYADTADGDPISHWKSLSVDGQGHDVLEQLGRILALPPAKLALGRDVENNAVFVWPYLAERQLDQLSATELADLATLMAPEALAAMRAKKKWTWWRLVIGADGTWHAFRKHD